MDEIRKCNSGCESYSRLSEHTGQCSYKFDVIVQTDMPCRYNLLVEESPLAEKTQSSQEADRRDNPGLGWSPADEGGRDDRNLRP